MASVTLVQNVANSPTNSYPVGVFKTADGAELQAVVLVDSQGEEYGALNPIPVGITTILPTLAVSRVSCTSGASTVVLSSNVNRVSGGMVINNTNESFFLQVGAAAVIGEGIPLPPGGIWQVNTKQEIRAIFTNSGSASLDVYEAT